MPYHRLTSPSYFGGLPAGYDFINAGLAPALVDGAKVGGPNAGTYFHAFGEPAISANFNRPAQALSENCDYLDDLLHRDLAVMTKTPDVTAGSVVSTITLPAGTFLGAPGTMNTARNIAFLFALRDANDQAIVDTTGANLITINSVTLTGDDAVGGGFSANTVDVHTSTNLQVGTTYRVYYGVRQNVAILGVDGLLGQGSFALAYGHENATARAHNAFAIEYGGGPAWADGVTTNPSTDVESQLDKIVGDLSGGAGAGRIGSAVITGTPINLAAGTVSSQLGHLLAFINALLPNQTVSLSSAVGTAFNSLAGGGGTTFYDIPGMSLGLSGCAIGDIILANWGGLFYMDSPTGLGEVNWYVDDGGQVNLLTESIQTPSTTHGIIHRQSSLTRLYTVQHTGTVWLKAQLRSLDVSAITYFDSGFIDAVRIRP